MLVLLSISLKSSAKLAYQIVLPVHTTYTFSHTRIHTRYLHPEEGDAGQQINSGLEILQTLWVSCREIILE